MFNHKEGDRKYINRGINIVKDRNRKTLALTEAERVRNRKDRERQSDKA